MRPLDDLVREATALGAGALEQPLRAEAEVDRVLQICNACRYCEGFCAVFPAMTRRLAFPAADVHYLANLCHNCGACLHACQYAPPHEFAVNVPQAMARVRQRTYAGYAWPQAFAAAYRRNGLVLALALAGALALFLVLAVWSGGSLWPAPRADGNFYRVFPHGLMVGLFLPVFGFAMLALGVGAWRFWRAQSPGPAGVATSAEAMAEAAHNALTLKYLDGGHGEGCNNEDDRCTLARRRAHHLTFYGFLLCFAATGLATLYHYAFGWVAPYAYTAAPKLLGIAGGLMLCAGTLGLWRLHRRRHALQGAPEQAPMDLGFIALLFLCAATGLALTALRASSAMAMLLALHLGCVMALFLTLPYGKFAHAVYRCAALLKWSIERRQPLALKLGSE
ncbi:MAG: tricarballylate utilization 4Fe-4S protein TcuB [Burkholderiaceae bacterium]|nr:tricarballylate utilization 4Fe-4S protein TcuB [Burkholderiaceae bacterium]